MLAVNFNSSSNMSETAMHVMNSTAFVLRIRLPLITRMVSMLPTLPNIKSIKRVISPKSHGLGGGLFLISFIEIFVVFINAISA
jgi:hypothetical protein